MATYVLIHGAGGSAWDWHLVAPQLRAEGHDVVAPDLPCDDESAGLAEYTDTVVNAIGDRTSLVVVAHSMGGFTAPLVCDRVPADLMVLLSGMIPAPGESPGDWWANTSQAQAMNELAERDGFSTDDMAAVFLHDVPPELAAEALRRSRDQSGTPFEKPWPLKAWPEVRTRILICRQDRMFPAQFQRRVARDRLGITTPDEMDGSHCAYLSRPQELAARLEALRAEPVERTSR